MDLQVFVDIKDVDDLYRVVATGREVTLWDRYKSGILFSFVGTLFHMYDTDPCICNEVSRRKDKDPDAFVDAVYDVVRPTTINVGSLKDIEKDFGSLENFGEKLKLPVHAEDIGFFDYQKIIAELMEAGVDIEASDLEYPNYPKVTRIDGTEYGKTRNGRYEPVHIGDRSSRSRHEDGAVARHLLSLYRRKVLKG